MKLLGILFLACITGISLAVTGAAQGEGVRKIKTSWKHYTLITHQGRDILCEPYVVRKNDWLFKIFKQKGEISEKDFPFFISIFKRLNPHIHNIDAISTGTRILIPLKITNRLDYTVDKEGRVKIPVVEFHDTAASSMPRISIQSHTIAPGDTVSSLLDPDFLNEGGGITREGQALFYQLNPHIKNMDRIFPGDRISLPSKAIRQVQTSPGPADPSPVRANPASVSVNPASVPADPPSPAITSLQMRQLKQYADRVNGRLLHQGTLYFPGRNGQKEVKLDLSETPLIEIDDPVRSVLILLNQTPHNPLQDKDVRQNISSYWGHVAFQSFETIRHPKGRQASAPAAPEPRLSRKQVFQILKKAGYDYVADDIIRFHVNQIPVSARLNRVKIPGRPDLLLNSGTVFGLGIEALRRNRFDILTFTAGQGREEQLQSLLTALGYTVWDHPSFTWQGKVETLPGIYAEHASNRLLVSLTPPATPTIQSFLEARQIDYVLLEP